MFLFEKYETYLLPFKKTIILYYIFFLWQMDKNLELCPTLAGIGKGVHRQSEIYLYFEIYKTALLFLNPRRGYKQAVFQTEFRLEK